MVFRKKIKNLCHHSQKKYLNKFRFYFNEKKIAIIGSGIAGLTLANFLYKDKKYDFMVYEKNESLPLDEGYGIQLSTNSIKILNQINFSKINSEKIFHPTKSISTISKIKNM